MSMLGTIVGGLAGLGDSLLQRSGQQEANRTNIKLAREQRQWQEDMWNMQNKYNHPIQQMVRMRQAGLNPHLMYGQGNVGNASDVKGYSRAQVENINKGWQGMSAMLQNRNIDATTNNVEANTANTIQERKNKIIDGLIKSLQLDRGKLDYKTAQLIQEYQVDSARALARTQDAHSQVATRIIDQKVEMAQVELERARAQTTDTEVSAQLKEWEKSLNKIGLSGSDPLTLRLMYTNPSGKRLIDALSSGNMLETGRILKSSYSNLLEFLTRSLMGVE